MTTDERKGEVLIFSEAFIWGLFPVITVLSYAKRIINDHQKADQKTMDLANRLDVALATIPASSEETELQSKLSGLSGTDFDQAYLKAMEKDHDKVIDHLTSAQKDVKNADIKNFVASILPTLHQHHDIAERVAKRESSSG